MVFRKKKGAPDVRNRFQSSWLRNCLLSLEETGNLSKERGRWNKFCSLKKKRVPSIIEPVFKAYGSGIMFFLSKKREIYRKRGFVGINLPFSKKRGTPALGSGTVLIFGKNAENVSEMGSR